MIKDNWFNRIFHSKKVVANQTEATRLTALYARRNEILKEISHADTLEGLLRLHKKAWKQGYRNENIGPCSYGMFRTENIETMTPDEVYLGNVYGLFTKNISFWEDHKEDNYGSNGYGINPETKLYDIILRQYRLHLKHNINAIVMDAKEMIDEYCEKGYEIYFQGPC